MTIHMQPVKSSSIDSVGYDAETKTLRLKFKGGGREYSYADVPEHVVTDLHQAESIGVYVTRHIVGKFKHTAHASA